MRVRTSLTILLLVFSPVGAGAGFAQEEDEELEEIVVTSIRGRRSFADLPTRVEVLGSEELGEKANMKPGDIRMLLNESTGIHVQQTSSTSFNSTIRIQGLDGKYTQLLRDGMPLYSGFSGGLSLLQVAPLDLAQVEVVKGASSTLFGGGAIAGLVNLVSRAPAPEPELSLLLNGTSADGLDTSAFYAGRSERVGTTLFGSYNRSDGYDPADSGFSAIPEFERWTFNPRLFLYGERSEMTLGINLVTEDRLGGDMDYLGGQRARPAYFEASDTLRLTSQLEYRRELAAGRELVVRNSISHFDRELRVPESAFVGTQLSSFSELHVVGAPGEIDWVAGLNLWNDEFDQHRVAAAAALDYRNETAGAFMQASLPLGERWVLEGGLRADHAVDYGNFYLPKFALLFLPGPDTTLRLGGGLGYKLPTPFSEEAERLQFQGVLPLRSRALEAERSTGFNADINHRTALGEEVSVELNLLLFYTRVDDPLVLSAEDQGRSAYRQPNGYLDSRGAELNAVFQRDDLRFFLGYTHADVREHLGGSVEDAPLIPKDRVNMVLVYEREEDLRVGLEAYYYSRQTLGDGTRSRDYWIFGLMMEKILGEGASVFLNFENFLDSRQTRYESIYTGTRENPQFRDLFAPLDGFVINGGIKLRF